MSKTSPLKESMRKFISNECLCIGKNFALSAGSKSMFYFDCKRAMLEGAFLYFLTEYILDEIIPMLPKEPHVVGGPTLGADFMTAALILKAYERGQKPRHASIIRKEPKKYGTKNCIENELGTGKKTILVMDDVITSGSALYRACEEFQSADYKILAMLAIVDREAGGLEYLQDKFNVPVLSIFTKSDFLR